MQLCNISHFRSKRPSFSQEGHGIWLSWQGYVFLGIGMALNPGSVFASPAYPQSWSLLQ